MSWDASFDEPIELPNGKAARTLREAGQYITKLPKTEHAHKAWQTAMHCLIEAACAFHKNGTAVSLTDGQRFR
jgi:hypothetical protein